MREVMNSVRCCWCGLDGIVAGTPVCPNCKKGIADVLTPDFILRSGRYRIDKALGKGGFGITYRALDTEFERYVAIKEYFPTSYAHRDRNTGSLTVTTDDVQSIQKGLESFQREGRHLARVEHPNIPTVYDRFDENNTSYMVMEFLEGKSLKQVMQGKPLPPEQVSQIMEALVSALAAVHAQGIHHLDIKPDNVIVQSSGRVVLIDFGAARQGTTFGDTSIAALTPGYAPLELQARQAYGPETDIFELGMMLHQMLTGKLPPSANERLLNNRDWEPEGVEEPWHALIVEATKLRQDERPKDVRTWWYRTAKVSDPEIHLASKTVERPTQGRHLGLLRPTTSDATIAPKADVRVPIERKTNPAVVGGVVVVLIGLTAVGAMFLKPPQNAQGTTPTPAASASPTATPAPKLTAEEQKKLDAELRQALNHLHIDKEPSLDKIAKASLAAIKKGANPDMESSEGIRALHVAAFLDDEELAKTAIEKGANVNARDRDGITPLHFCAQSGTPAVARLLLANGADKNAKNKDSKIPLQIAEEYDQAALIRILKEAK